MYLLETREINGEMEWSHQDDRNFELTSLNRQHTTRWDRLGEAPTEQHNLWRLGTIFAQSEHCLVANISPFPRINANNAFSDTCYTEPQQMHINRAKFHLLSRCNIALLIKLCLKVFVKMWINLTLNLYNDSEIDYETAGS